jgi:hypothetical protein
MPIRPFLADQAFEPEIITAMSLALGRVYDALRLKAIDDIATRLVAEKIITVGHDSPLPAALVSRRSRPKAGTVVLHHPRRRPRARVRVFRGGAGDAGRWPMLHVGLTSRAPKTDSGNTSTFGARPSISLIIERLNERLGLLLALSVGLACHADFRYWGHRRHHRCCPKMSFITHFDICPDDQPDNCAVLRNFGNGMSQAESFLLRADEVIE